VKPTPALVRLERRLTRNRTVILGAPEVVLLQRETGPPGDEAQGAAMRPEGWVVDMQHYLDEETGDLPPDLPSRSLNLVLFFGSIVAWVTDHLPHGDWHTNVPCRRSPGRKRCLGEIIATLNHASGAIEWQCSVCGDNGAIHGWEDTLWNRSGPGAASPPPSTSSARH
jgi:hypothetical protein